MKYEVRIYPSAELDLSEIKSYIEQELDASVTGLFRKFVEAVDRLELNPYIYPAVRDPVLAGKGYRYISIDNFLIFYVVTEQVVQIRRVLYGRRHYPEIL